jgi:Domain of unknown function (DUF4167)
MRSSKSRSRSKTNRPRTLGNIINRVFDSSGPEGKVRGTPAQIIEKYQFLARDAQLSNDRVAAENFQQHAEHYTRMLAEATREMEAENAARQQQYGQSGQPGGQQNGNGNGNGQQPQQNQNRDQNQNRGPRDDNNDRRDFRNDRPDQRNDQRGDRNEQPQQRNEYRQDYREDRAPSPIDVVEPEDDMGLVETPEQHRAEPRQEQRSYEPRSDRQNDRQNDRPPEPRQQDARPPRTDPRPPRAPRPVVDQAPVLAPMMPTLAAPEEAPEAPRRARAPRKPKAEA